MSKFQKRLRKQPPYIQTHFDTLNRRIKSGVGVRELQARPIERFKDDVRRLSVRLSRSHRLILQKTESGLVPEWVGTHQEYDKWLKR